MSKLNIIRCSYFLIFGLVLSGCKSTQHVEKPDIGKLLSEGKSVIQLKRESYLVGSARSPDVYSGTKLIGSLGNGDELIWAAEPNTLECITLDDRWPIDQLVHIRLDNTPSTYKCFTTKPKEALVLMFDFLYAGFGSEGGAAIYKYDPVTEQVITALNKDTKVSINIINSISEDIDTPGDLTKLLEDAMNKRFSDRLSSSSVDVIELEILDYKTGHAFLRWMAETEKGTTLVKVKVTIKKHDRIVDSFITRPAITMGGLLSVGADTSIFNNVAEDVYLYVYGSDE